MTREEYEIITQKILDYGYQMLDYGVTNDKNEKEKANKIREEITDMLIKHLD